MSFVCYEINTMTESLQLFYFEKLLMSFAGDVSDFLSDCTNSEQIDKASAQSNL